MTCRSEAECDRFNESVRKLEAERDAAVLQNGEMLAALIALADRVSVRFGEIIKYEPVATGRYLDAAYEVIGKVKATEKPIGPADFCPEHGGLWSYKCPSCAARYKKWYPENRKCECACHPTNSQEQRCGVCNGNH